MATTAMFAPLSNRADAAMRVKLLHQIVSRWVSVYSLQIEMERVAPGHPAVGSEREVHTGRITRALFGEDRPGRSTCVQMIELSRTPEDRPAPPGERAPPEEYDAEEPAPVAADRPGAIRGRSVHFSSGPVSVERAPLLVPADAEWSRGMMALLLDVTNWQDEKVGPGDGWTQPFRLAGVAGEQRYRVDAIELTDDDRLVRLSVSAEPVEHGAPTQMQLLWAESTLTWSARDRDLLLLEGTLRYREPLRSGGHEVRLSVRCVRIERVRLPGEQEDFERKAVVELIKAIAAYRRQDDEDAQERLQQFMKRWPNSRWSPLARDLDRRITHERTGLEPLPVDGLKESLVTLLAKWNGAENDGHEQTLAECRASLSHLVKVNHDTVAAMLVKEEPRFQALALFALAFGQAPADVALMQGRCQDESPLVRQTAYRALAIRGSALADPDRLLAGLDDADALVRQRACEALGTCLSEESPARDRAREALAKRLHDNADPVAVAAARALIRIGTPEDIRRIEQAARDAAPMPLQDLLEAVLDEVQR